MATIAEALAIAAEHHQAGRLAEAETLYRRILDADPENAAALHLLGVLAAQLGHFEAAAALIGRAIAHNSTVSDYYRHRAMAFDRLGRLEEAAADWEQAASLAPNHAPTQFNLGTLLDRLGRRDVAAEAYARALAADPAHAEAANNRGLALRALGRTAEAAESFALAGGIAPGFAAAWYHRALALTALGQSVGATAALRRAVVADPALAIAHVNLGNALGEGEAGGDRAERHYRHALRIDPGLSAAWRGLARLLHAGGRYAGAAEAFAAAIRTGGGEATLWDALGTCRMAAGDPAGALLAFTIWTVAEPGDPEGHYVRGIAAGKCDALAAAESSYRRTALLVGIDSRPLNNLALLRLRQGRHADALPPLRLVVALQPQLAEPYHNLGLALRALDRAPEGVGAYRAALRLDPTNGATAYNRAVDLQELGRIDEAAAGYRHVLALDPGNSEAYCNLGSVVRATARYDASTACYRHALALRPDDVAAHRNLLSAILYDPDWSEERRFAEHRRFEERHARPLYPLQRPHIASGPPDRRLRIGYLSSDFREHPVARNLEPIFVNHDHDRVEITAYSHLVRHDAVTARFKAAADRWRDVGALSDAEVAELIRADGIDVLILLAGRFDNNRPLVAAYRPAPVQISFYDGATSGLSAVDAILTDRTLTPRDGAERFAERPIRLPTLYAYGPIPDAPDIGPLPIAARGSLTFGSFNNPSKVCDAALALWARVLRAVPDARLVLKYKNLYAAPSLQDRVRAAMQAGGVDPDRVLTPAAVQGRQHHLALYNGVDIGLDPFPFCGATTSFEALYMGVPVITLPGSNMMSRWSASLLDALDLPDLIAGDEDAYVRIAASLAADPARLAGLRRDLRGRILSASFLDGRTKARQVERVCRALWCRWHAGAAVGRDNQA